jgi:hypothetical protein
VGQWSRSTTPAGSQHPPALHHLRTCARAHLEQRAWEADACLAQILAARCEHASKQFTTYLINISHTFRDATCTDSQSACTLLHSNVCLIYATPHFAGRPPSTRHWVIHRRRFTSVETILHTPWPHWPSPPAVHGHTALAVSSSIECVGVVASLVVVASRRGCFHVTSESRHSGLHLTHLTAQ